VCIFWWWWWWQVAMAAMVAWEWSIGAVMWGTVGLLRERLTGLDFVENRVAPSRSSVFDPTEDHQPAT